MLQISDLLLASKTERVRVGCGRKWKRNFTLSIPVTLIWRGAAVRAGTLRVYLFEKH